MGDNLDFQSLSSPLASAKNILVLIAANPNIDKTAAALALFLSLKKLQKSVVIGCPTEMTVALNRLIGVNKVSQKIGSRNLVISFDYIQDSIEKVSYNIEDNKFNLVVEPKAQAVPLNSDNVSYTYTGVEAEMIFIIGAAKLEDLQEIYLQNKKIFTDSLTVNIDNSYNNSKFGKMNLFDPQVSSCSEIVAGLIKKLNLPADADIATNLYAGIKINTGNFQGPNVTAEVFENSAWCLKNGAKKDYLGETSIPEASTSQTSQPITTVIPQIFTQPSVAQPPFVKNNSSLTGQPGNQPPPDWFKPKIFRGNKKI